MKKSKKISEPRDRLSELPNSLIFHIFLFLPMTYVVRTTVLSKRWENLWTTTPYLNFEDCMMDISTEKVRNFLNRALIFWRGDKILKFKIEVASDVEESLYRDIDLWVHFAKKNGVEELYMDFRYVEHEEEREEFEYLYASCPSLKVLRLKDCRLQIHGNPLCNRLKSLTIDGPFYLNAHKISQILSGSPQLEVFNITLAQMNEDLSIRSSSLKRLSIESSLEFDDSPMLWKSELKIWTPRLETLEIFAVPYGSYSLMDVSCLTHVTLGFHWPKSYGTVVFEDEDEDEDDGFLLEDPVIKILPTIQHVENLTLSNWCIQVLGFLKSKCLLSPLSNVKLLKLYGRSFAKHKQIVGLLESFPKMETLVIQHKLGADLLKESLKESFLPQLRTVEVTWAEGDNLIFPLIEKVLKYASKLEKMVFRVKGVMPPARPSKSLFLASQKLLRMPRSSPIAELIFCEY